MSCFPTLFLFVALLFPLQRGVRAQGITSPQGFGLFDSDSILDLRISGDLKPLMNDRSETPSDHPMTISYRDAGKEHALSVTMRTRGHFRKTMGDCDDPPLLIAFQPAADLSGAICHAQRKTKLVVPCRDA